MAFKDRLREAREAKGLTQQELANIVGVSKSAIANYETGVSAAKEQVLIKLFSALDVTPNYLWQDEMEDVKSSFVCSYHERVIIQKYRDLDDHGKRMVDIVIKEETERMEQEQQEDVLQIDLFDLPASAGFGLPLEGDYRTIIEAPDTPLNRKADFCIRVAGDSMEPDYSDGDIVLVKKSEVYIGDVGIFVLDGESYIKELGKDVLISRNPKYNDIPLPDFDRIMVAGKVIGKL